MGYPLFHADRIETPVVMMRNDNDGAVPWGQGIEMVVAMRCTGKEVYLVSYNGDEHDRSMRANQADITLRRIGYLGRHLRREPMPRGMAEGIPCVEKGYR